MESLDFCGLSLKLQKPLERLRDVSKVVLKQFESLESSEAALTCYKPVDVFAGDEAHDDFTLF